MRVVLLSIITLFAIFRVEVIVEGMRNALGICAVAIVPSLFVFLVMSEIIVTAALSERNSKISPKWTTLFLGSICGFPIGAVVCERFYKNGCIAEKDAERMLPICNNTSPAYVIGAIGTTMLSDKRIGVLLFISEIITAVLLFLPIKCKYNGCFTINSFSVKSIFFDATEKAVNSILRICAIVCIFGAIIALVRDCLGEKAYIITAVLLELSSGAACISGMFAEKPMLTISVLGFICGWSGICVHLQILSAVKSIKVKYYKFVFVKAIQGILTAALTLLGYKMFICS